MGLSRGREGLGALRDLEAQRGRLDAVSHHLALDASTLLQFQFNQMAASL